MLRATGSVVVVRLLLSCGSRDEPVPVPAPQPAPVTDVVTRPKKVRPAVEHDDKVRLRDQTIWWDGQRLLTQADGGPVLPLGPTDQSASAPDAREACANESVLAIRLWVGSRIAIMVGGSWQVYDAPQGELICRDGSVIVVAASGRRQDCSTGGCREVARAQPQHARQVAAPFFADVMTAWPDADGVRVRIPRLGEREAYRGALTSFELLPDGVVVIDGTRAMRVHPDGTVTPVQLQGE